MKSTFKCEINYFVLIKYNRNAWVGILILALNYGGILKKFAEILGKYRIFDGRFVGLKGKFPFYTIRIVGKFRLPCYCFDS